MRKQGTATEMELGELRLAAGKPGAPAMRRYLKREPINAASKLTDIGYCRSHDYVRLRY